MPKGKAVYRYSGKRLTGINELKGCIKTPVVILGSGTSLRKLDWRWIPAGWPVFAVNEAVACKPGRNDYWVLSDKPIVREYGGKVAPVTTILAMHEATHTIEAACPKNKIYTTNSMSEVKPYRNGYEFFSRGTVLIGAIEMAKWMGAKEFYIFGLDCYRHEGGIQGGYYFDGRRPKVATEHLQIDRERVRLRGQGAPRIYVTRRLAKMINRLKAAKDAGLWKKIKVHCVNSPWSQNGVFPHMTAEEFQEIAKDFPSQIEIDEEAARQDGNLPSTEGDTTDESRAVKGQAEAGADHGAGLGDGAGEPGPSPDTGDGNGDEGGDPEVLGDRNSQGDDVTGDDPGAGAAEEEGNVYDL